MSFLRAHSPEENSSGSAVGVAAMRLRTVAVVALVEGIIKDVYISGLRLLWLGSRGAGY